MFLCVDTNGKIRSVKVAFSPWHRVESLCCMLCFALFVCCDATACLPFGWKSCRVFSFRQDIGGDISISFGVTSRTRGSFIFVCVRLFTVQQSFVAVVAGTALFDTES